MSMAPCHKHDVRESCYCKSVFYIFLTKNRLCHLQPKTFYNKTENSELMTYKLCECYKTTQIRQDVLLFGP